MSEEKPPQLFNRNFYSDDPASGFADLVPVKNDKGEIIGYDTKLVNTALPDGSDAYANFNQTFLSFQNIRTGGDKVFFKAFITAFNESYTPDFNPTQVFGRTDPIYQYKGTTRAITLAWKMPASSDGEAYENLVKVQRLVGMLYPNYTDASIDGNALTLSEAPLVRLKMMNLIQKVGTSETGTGDNPRQIFNGYKSTSTDQGLLGVITSCTINHNLEGTDGVFEKIDYSQTDSENKKGKTKNTILPKLIDINISFSPLHETTLTGKMPMLYGANISNMDKDRDEFKSREVENGRTLSELRALKRTIEEKRKSASEQQDLDRKKAKALRLQDKFMAAERGSRREERLMNRSIRADNRAGVDGEQLAATRDAALETLAEADALESLI